MIERVGPTERGEPGSAEASVTKLRLGIDLGGTKIELVALGAHGQELHRKRVPTPQADYAATVAAMAALVRDAESRLGARGTVGIGIPGSVSPADGRVRNANSTCLNGQLLRQDLERALAREVRLANDANCLAASEATDGAAAGTQVVFAVILGTGVGGGIAIHGQALAGHNAVAGEWGHNPLPWQRGDEHPGPPCWCGRLGCIETWLSGPGFVADHARAVRVAGVPPADAPAFDAAAVVQRMRSGDPVAVAAFDRYVDRLARALAHVINVLDPNAIVLGGGMSNVEELYERVPRAWGANVFSDIVATPLVRAAHGDSSGVRGAAWLWP